MNFDAATDQATGWYGIGVVARDAHGCVLLTAAKRLRPLVSAEAAEIMAADWAVSLAKENPWSLVVIEGDAALVIEALKGVRKRGLHAQVLIENVRRKVVGRNNLSFDFCYREGNMVAHKVANWALLNNCISVWIDACPMWIRDCVIVDFFS